MAKKSKKIDYVFLRTLLIIVLVGVVLFNQYMIYNITTSSSAKTISSSSQQKQLSTVNIEDLKSTAHSIYYLFDVENVKTNQDAIDLIIPTGTPEYGAALGISYNDPVSGLSKLVQVYNNVQLDSGDQQRYVNIVTKPVGISCEFCCGLGAIAADSKGESICGCQHTPALLGLTKWLVQNTDYSDQEIIKEALKWKALFFPKNMVELTLQVAGEDSSSLEEMPTMVGGC